VIVETEEGRVYAQRVNIEGPSTIAYFPQKIEGGANVYIETDAVCQAIDVETS